MARYARDCTTGLKFQTWMMSSLRRPPTIQKMLHGLISDPRCACGNPKLQVKKMNGWIDDVISLCHIWQRLGQFLSDGLLTLAITNGYEV